MTSYYDAIGLLAICDAIDSVEGVPVSAFSTRPLSPSPSPSPPNANAQTPKSAVGAVGTHPSTGKKPDTPPYVYAYPPEDPSTLSEASLAEPATPLIPFNYEGAGMDAAALAASGRAYPMFLAHPLHHHAQDDSFALSAKDKTLDSPYPASHSSSARHYSLGAKAADSSYAIRKREQRASRRLGLASSSGSSLLSDLKSGDKPYYKTNHPHHHTPTASPSHADPTTAGGRPPLIIGGYKVEECPICGRNFKGPKASTHKQQHIRRLHPEDYTPKRGGKKRVVNDSPM